MTDPAGIAAPVPDTAAPAGPSRRALISRLVKIGFGLAALVFGVVFVVSRWPQLRPALAAASPGWLVLAAVCAAAGQWAGAFGLGAVLEGVAGRLPGREVAKVYFVSQLGKYIPGSVWPILALAELCRRHHIARSAAVAGGILALVFSLASAGAFGIVFVVIGTIGTDAGLWWLILLLPVVVVLAQPRVVLAGLNWLLRLVRRPPVTLGDSARLRARVLAWPTLSWFLLGLQCWCLVVALGGRPGPSLAAAMGGFALAYAAGTLFVPAPAGAGVREAVLGLALTSVIADGSRFDHNSVIVVVLLSRVLLAVLDFGQAGASLLYARNGRASA